VVYKGQETLQVVRFRELERVVLIGSVENGIETVFLSYGGKFRGRLVPVESKNVFLRHLQSQRYENEDFRLRLSRQVVDGKVRNARVVLQKYARNHPSEVLTDAVKKLDAARSRAANQTSIESLLGCEGECASIYFGALGTMTRSEFTFTTRTRRPPRDAINALLSFGYTLLSTELTGALAAQGLDPCIGFLHDLDYGRPSLALDILEEFRQPISDRLALSLTNLGVLTMAHFEGRGESGVYLNDPGRQLYLEFYHRALEAEFQIRGADAGSTTYGELFRRQAKRIRDCFENDVDYEPYAAR
jgi:CRISPR-associated protein Cas1